MTRKSELDSVVTIKATRENLLYYLFGFLGNFIWYGATITFLLSDIVVLASIAFLIACRKHLLGQLELVLTKKLFLKNDNLYLSIAFFTFKLNRNLCRLEIDDIGSDVRNTHFPEYVLTLILNKNRLLFSLFKNRIRLYIESKKLDIIEEMLRLSEVFKITSVPFESQYDPYYTHDIKTLVRPKNDSGALNRKNEERK